MWRLLVATPTNIPILRTRGDTFPFTFIMKDGNGEPVDITGYTYLLTVDPEEKPVDSSNNIFQLTGTITEPAAGKVTFSLSVLQSDNLGSNYYDLQQTDDTAAVRTVAKGTWTIEQDITK